MPAERGAPLPIKVAELTPGSRVQETLFHEDGTLLLLPGLAVDELVLRALNRAGVETVYACASEEEAGALRGGAFEELRLEEIPFDVPLAWNLYDEFGELVRPAGQALSEGPLRTLERRRPGEPLRLFRERSAYEKRRERFEELLASATLGALEEEIDGHRELLSLKRMSREPGVPRELSVAPAARSRAGAQEVRRLHAAGLEDVNSIFETLRWDGRLDVAASRETVLGLLKRMKRDLPLVLALKDTPIHRDYVVEHSLAVSACSLAEGIALGLAEQDLVELGLAGLLHDVGMLKVPKDILDKPGALTPGELAEIRKHPEHGLDALRRSGGVSFGIMLAVVQDHERPGGRGYPAGRQAEFIHDIAKLIAVSDIYQAMTAPRPYRARRPPHKAVRHILRMFREGLLDGDACRAFLAVHGLYPTGSWVELADGRKARVVGPPGDDPARPPVMALFDGEGEALEVPQHLDLSAGHGRLEVAGPLEGAPTASAGAESLAGFCTEGLRGLVTKAGAEGGAKKVPQDYMDWSASFSGYLTDFGVADIMKILDLSQKSGRLLLRFPEGEGRIAFADGEILSARLALPGAGDEAEAEGGGLRDEEAIFEMLGRADGTFTFEQGVVKRRKTVRLNSAAILMEGSRRIDEKGRDRA